MRSLPLLTATLCAAAGPARAQSAAPNAGGARPPRLSFESSLLGTLLPEPLAVRTVCEPAARAGLGLALGAGYRLRGHVRAEGRLGTFGHPGFGQSDCVSAPRRPPDAGTVERTADFDPVLTQRRGFAQGRLVADVGGRDVLRLAAGGGTLLGVRAPFASAGVGVGQRMRGAVVVVEVEQWWMRAPAIDRTTVWEAQPAPAGAPAGVTYPAVPVVTAERRFTRGVGATWVRLSATLPVPGT